MKLVLDVPGRERIARFGWCRRSATLVAMAAMGLLITASGAKAAGCAVPYVVGAKLSLHSLNAPAGNATSSAREENESDNDGDRSIVGLWHLTYTATYDNNFPPGQAATPPFPFLESYKTWHSDGTEFENAFLPPPGGNICFGVWKDLGHGSVKLHHVGLMFNPAGQVANVFTVDEIDTVSPSGNTYTGSFDFKLFGPTDVYGKGTPLAEVKGTTSGTRITVD